MKTTKYAILLALVLVPALASANTADIRVWYFDEHDLAISFKPIPTDPRNPYEPHGYVLVTIDERHNLPVILTRFDSDPNEWHDYYAPQDWCKEFPYGTHRITRIGYYTDDWTRPNDSYVSWEVENEVICGVGYQVFLPIVRK
jgi:hypothetical protein